jgi:hypothetical protein
LHTLDLGRSFTTLREPCNNHRLRCAIVWLHVTNHVHHGFPSYSVKQFHACKSWYTNTV